MKEKLDSPLVMDGVAAVTAGRAAPTPQFNASSTLNWTKPAQRGSTTMTPTLEIKQATALEVTPRRGPKKLKNFHALAAPRPASTKCEPVSLKAVARKEYLRALRAAEMAAWEAANQTVRAALPAPVIRWAGRAETVADLRQEAWESRLYVALAAAAIIGVLANAGALSGFVEGWSQFAALVQRIVS